jgi:hypothetical protein
MFWKDFTVPLMASFEKFFEHRKREDLVEKRGYDICYLYLFQVSTQPHLSHCFFPLESTGLGPLQVGQASDMLPRTLPASAEDAYSALRP